MKLAGHLVYEYKMMRKNMTIVFSIFIIMIIIIIIIMMMMAMTAMIMVIILKAWILSSYPCP